MKGNDIRVTFFTVTSEMVEMGLSGNNLLIYAFIASYGASGYWGTYDTIALRTNCSANRIKHIIPKMIQEGYFERCYIKTEDGRIRPCLRVKTKIYAAEDITEGELPLSQEEQEEAEIGVIMDDAIDTAKDRAKEREKKKKGETKAWNDAIKSEYQSVRDELYSEQKVTLEKCCMNSAVINTRLKNIRESIGCTVQDMRGVFRAMKDDDFCVKELSFDFEKLLSEKLFFKFLNKYKESEAVSAPPPERQGGVFSRPVCKVCGQPLNGQGLCYQCDFDIIIAGNK